MKRGAGRKAGHCQEFSAAASSNTKVPRALLKSTRPSKRHLFECPTLSTFEFSAAMVKRSALPSCMPSRCWIIGDLGFFEASAKQQCMKRTSYSVTEPVQLSSCGIIHRFNAPCLKSHPGHCASLGHGDHLSICLLVEVKSSRLDITGLHIGCILTGFVLAFNLASLESCRSNFLMRPKSPLVIKSGRLRATTTNGKCDMLFWCGFNGVS